MSNFKIFITAFLLLSVYVTVSYASNYPDCFTGDATVRIKSVKQAGMKLGDQLSVLGGQICEFQTYGDVMIDYWSSDIIIGYYEYKGVGDNCTESADEKSYTSQTLLQTKVKSNLNGTCSYLIFIENSDTSGYNFTIDVYRNAGSFMAVSIFTVAALISSQLWGREEQQNWLVYLTHIY